MRNGSFDRFIDLYKTYWTNFIRFEGRTSREAFWITILLAAIIGALLALVCSLLGVIGNIVIHGFCILSVLPTLSLWWRRMHDTGRDGWWSLVPLLNIIFAIGMSDVANRFGDVPSE